MSKKQLKKFQTGATFAEFVTVTPVILFLGLGSVQAGLIYHGKSTLNYATFEAARAGAVSHAQIDTMMQELGFRLAPLVGGDGSASRARDAIAISMEQTKVPLSTDIEILNPSAQAFDDWGQLSHDVGVRVIPNSHLRHRNTEREQVGTHSGLNLHDANLLKIKVTHGFRMKIPFVGRAFAEALRLIDHENAHYYEQNQLPIHSVATVRMQSEAWESEAYVNAAATPAGFAAPDENNLNVDAVSPLTTCADEYGLSGHDALMSSITSTSSASGMCQINTTFGDNYQNSETVSTPETDASVVSGDSDECA
jgi:antitoxin component HigA of HigAB toxin-antitoxin module